MKKERMLIMSVFKKIIFITIFILFISISYCYAIDENQLSSNQYPTSDSQTQTEGNNQSSITNGQTTDNANVENNINTSVQETTNTNTITASRTENQSSTTVGNVSSNSKTSTITNILNIALLVVGLLLIFLAIAILIRLNT